MMLNPYKSGLFLFLSADFYSPNYKAGEHQNLMIDSVHVQTEEHWSWFYNNDNAWKVLKTLGYEMSGFMMDTVHVLTVDCKYYNSPNITCSLIT